MQDPLPQAGQIHGTNQQEITTRFLTPVATWKMVVDLGRKSISHSTTLRPDVVLWSAAVKSATLIKLTVPWKEGLDASHERKRGNMPTWNAEKVECRTQKWQINIIAAQGPDSMWSCHIESGTFCCMDVRETSMFTALVNNPLVDRDWMFFLLLHINLGLIKQTTKARDKNGGCFTCAKYFQE